MIDVMRWLAATAVALLPSLSAPARVERPVPFRVGETLTYDVSWESFLTAGTITASVQEKKPSYGSVAYYIVVEGRPTPLVARLYSLYYKMDTLLDSYSLLSQRGATYAEEGSHRRYHATRFDRAARRAFFEDQKSDIHIDFAVPPTVQDPLAAIYALRTTGLRTGESRTVTVSDNGSTFDVPITIGAREPVRTPAGDANAWRVDAKLPGADGRAETISLWIADTERRLPMKVRADMPAGRFTIVLREAR